MKKTLKNFASLVGLVAISGVFPACSCGDDDDDGNNNPDASDVDAPGVDADPNAFPVLGTQIDRSGRPAITSALIKSMVFTDAADQAALRDQYNADDDPATWAADYTAEITTHLGVLDSLDASRDINGNTVNGCGNQLLYDDVNNSYAPLAGALANDRLLIDTSNATCAEYLAVEATVNGIPGLENDCGGRTPLMDVIDRSYSVLGAGVLAGVSDGVPPTATANITAFPFLGEPLPPN